MDRDNVVSSNISSIGYDSTTKTLEIEFNDRSVYQYDNVPQNEYDGLMSADSHGSYLHANIKGKYSYNKL